MAVKDPKRSEYQIPKNRFKDEFSCNPWEACTFVTDLGVAQTVAAAVDRVKPQGLVLPSGQELAAYLLSAKPEESVRKKKDGSTEYWLRTSAYVSRVRGEWEFSVCDEAQQDGCILYKRANEVSQSQACKILALPKNDTRLVTEVRLRSSIEGRRLSHPGDDISIKLDSEDDARILVNTKDWESVFGALGYAFAKRVYRARAQWGLPTIVRYEYLSQNVLDRDVYTCSEGMRAVRISAIDAPEFKLRFNASFREEGLVLGVKNPKGFYMRHQE